MKKATAAQKWATANRIWVDLCEALQWGSHNYTDEQMHKRLQYQLDRMHTLRTEARAEDPKVGRGILIATVRL